MDHVRGLKCVLCGRLWDADHVLYTCPSCGVQGILDVVYDYDLIHRRLTREGLSQDPERSIWRYRPLLPVARRTPAPSLQVGWTPLYHAKRLGDSLRMRNLYIKDDGRNPTASFKDRASAIGVMKAQEHDFHTITCASTGNAASSLAGFAASLGLPAVIFVPKRAPLAKVAQLLVFGARVMMVRGNYDQAFDLCLAVAEKHGWYSRSTAINPYLSEGKKTASLEICEQLGWQAPDKIFVSVGDGCIIGGLWKGLKDLQALGWIDRFPQLVGVQAEGAAPLVKAWESGSETIVPMVPETVADSISVGIPRDGIKALRAVRESKGRLIAVSDEAILDAMRILGRQAAVFAEPAGATAFAGLLKMLKEERIHPDEQVVVLVTGNGLKDADSAIIAGGQPQLIEPTLEAVDDIVSHW